MQRGGGGGAEEEAGPRGRRPAVETDLWGRRRRLPEKVGAPLQGGGVGPREVEEKGSLVPEDGQEYRTPLRDSRVDNKDHKTLERLRAERQAKIDELKEKTNYYTTQQLIQRYDLDPAAKAAAASVLASKLGADSGLRFHVGDESNVSASGKSYDAELVQSAGLHNRKPSQARGHSTGSSTTSEFIDETLNEYIADTQEIGSPNQRVVERLEGSALGDRGWLARVAALLVGEDPTQCYALICAHCHMHNGLAKEEDFSYITYYCPHCHGLNGSRRSEEHEMGLSSGKDTPTSSLEGDNKRTVASSLAAVEEIPGRTDENELDSIASSGFDTRDSCRD
ncbi:uncharacterized protein At2g24330-like isoform X2 [Musa acuminata AAA Group]|uniref:uncharacterized protein At2g24330-like isoform X2 n=1 Tax=Musa acuminata AAA Group TaxID=214697 RepID=UPI0031D59CEC